MKNLYVILVIMLASVVVLSCEPNEAEISDQEEVIEGKKPKPTKEEDDPDFEQQEALVMLPCSCETGVCEIICSGYDPGSFSAITTIRDRPCEFPMGCFPFPVLFKEFRVQIKSEFINLTKLHIMTENNEIVASSEEELGGSLKLDKEKGVIYVNLALVDDELLSKSSLIMTGQTGVLDGNNEVQLAKFEYKMGDNFFEPN